MQRVGVIQAGFGNSATIVNMLRISGVEAFEITSPLQISNFSHLVLPGVGHWSRGVKMLNEGGGWNDAICDHALKELPLLGVCLGMQLLGKASAEGNGAGLSLLDFKVQPLGGTGANTNVGWRKVTDIMGPDSEIFKRSYFYFTHSYCVPRADASFEWLVSGDEVEFVAGVRSGNIWGLQFHPERSSHAGQELLQRFAKI